jgi:head-tail adaptor
MMKAAEFKDRVEVFQPDSTADAYGELVTEYVSDGVKWCKVVKQRGSVQTIADNVQYVYPFVFFFRHFVEVSKFSRLKFQGEFYAVDSILQREEVVEVNAHTIDSSLVKVKEV